MGTQPEIWVGAVGGLVTLAFILLAIHQGIREADANPQPRRNLDLFKLGEVYDEPYYRPSPTNFIREIDKKPKK